MCTLLKLRSERKERTQKTNFYFVDCCTWTHTPVNDPIKNNTWTVSGQSKCYFEAEVKLNSSGGGSASLGVKGNAGDEALRAFTKTVSEKKKQKAFGVFISPALK